MINLERLDNLKLMLSHEENLAKIWLYFTTHFADHWAFTDMGEPIRHIKYVGILTIKVR